MHICVYILYEQCNTLYSRAATLILFHSCIYNGQRDKRVINISKYQRCMLFLYEMQYKMQRITWTWLYFSNIRRSFYFYCVSYFITTCSILKRPLLFSPVATRYIFQYAATGNLPPFL